MRKTHKALAFLSFAALFWGAKPLIAQGHVDVDCHTAQSIDEALDQMRKFLTDPDYQVVSSFKTYCRELGAHLQKSPNPRLKELGTALLRIAGQTNAFMIGTVLVKFKDVFEEDGGRLLPVQTLKARLEIALKL